METIIISSEFYFKAPYCELTSDAKLLCAPVKRFAASKI